MAVDIATIHDRTGLAQAIAGRSDEEINQSLTGRASAVVDRIAENMRTHFVPEKAAKQRAVIQYEVKTPDGVKTFQVNIADGKCEVQPGTALPPKVTLNMSLPDLLRLASGKMSALHAIMTGRLGVSGDIFLARKLQGWFES
ncbi:MAG TPA: SCP2 sterol-binding domain-containing protein [Polyangiaceae bacterium]|nr:SCP2 sterol-binding domain-containing protein [Polyangiaceae bacterium]